LDNFKTLTILYVDDDKGTRDNLLFYLKNSFKNVYTASNGIEGVELFKKEPSIDLVISDIYMPKMDGLKMMKEIKKISPKIPFLLITAHNDQKYMLEAIELGSITYIVKPVDINVLLEKIKFVYESISEQKTLDLLVKKMSPLENLNINQLSKALDKIFDEIKETTIIKLYKNYKYDFDNKCIIADYKIIHLNHQEIKVIEYLIKHKNQVVSYEVLMNYISNNNPSIDTLRTTIKSIRKKTNKNIIINLSGIGYKIDI